MRIKNAFINAVVLVLIAAPAFAVPAKPNSQVRETTTIASVQKTKKPSVITKIRNYFKSPKVVTTKKKVVKTTKTTFGKLKKAIHNATK
jgi:hypothetical protein